MPVRCEILSAEGRLIKEVPPTPATEISYLRDYSCTQVGRIIGLECLMSDLGGVIHIVDDPRIIKAVNEGVDIKTVFSEETAVIELVPEDTPVKIPFVTRKGRMGEAAVYHSFPPYIPTLN